MKNSFYKSINCNIRLDIKICTGGAPGIVICCFSNFGLCFRVVHYHIGPANTNFQLINESLFNHLLIYMACPIHIFQK